MRPYKPAPSYDVAPWRDPRWRTLVKNRLGAQTPNDTLPMSQEIYDVRLKMIELRPVEQRQMAIADLQAERIASYMDDGKWEQWYDHYHQIVLQQRDPDVDPHVRTGLNFNLQTAALYVLISAIVVPRVRHWWCVLPACLWFLILLAEIYWAWKRFSDKWYTLSDQLKYLSGDELRP